MTGSAVTMSDIIANIGELVTGTIGWMGQIVTFITSNPIVMIFVTLSLVGLAVGLLGRVLGLRG